MTRKIRELFIMKSSFHLQSAGMKEGDYIVGINEDDVKWSPHDEVVALIKASANSLKLRVVTPMDGKPKVCKMQFQY